MSTEISLCPLAFATVRAVIALSVSEAQAGYVAPNAVSIAEGLLNPGGWPRAIHADDDPVGFLMLNDPAVPGAVLRGRPLDPGSIMLWRLMIDQRHQGRGYARRALDLAVEEVHRRGARILVTSFVPGPHGPERFYLRYGFVPTGRFRADGRETELELRLGSV